MNNIYKTFFILSFLMIFSVSFGQSISEKKLNKNWISTIKTFETGDTIKYINEELNLKKDGSLTWLNKGMTLPGKWKYLQETNLLQMTIEIGGRAETVALFVDKITNHDLILTQRKGDSYMTVMYKVKDNN